MGTQPRCVQTPIWTSHSPVFSPAKSVIERFSSDASAVGHVGVARVLIDQILKRHLACCCDLFFGAVADEHGLAEEKDRQLRAHRDTAHIDAHLACGLHVGGRVHLELTRGQTAAPVTTTPVPAVA
jgi:hypothetical protein